MADDDFDSWLKKETPGSAAAARAKGTPAAKPTESSSWFGGSLLESFNSTTASLASTLTSDPLLKSVGDQLSGVAGQLRQHLDDSVSAFKEEEASPRRARVGRLARAPRAAGTPPGRAGVFS